MLRLLPRLLNLLPLTRSSSMPSPSTGTNGSERSNIHRNYRDFQESAKRDQELKRLLIAKNADVPYDDMRDLTITNHRGIGLGGLIAAGLTMGLLGTGVGAGALVLLPLVQKLFETPPAPPAPAPETKVEREVYDYGIETRVIPPQR